MAVCVCKCLNIKLESDEVEDNVDIKKLELTSTEQRDIFFSEKLLLCPMDAVRIQVAQPALMRQHTVGRWTLHCCLACRQTTHAIILDRLNIMLIPKSTRTTQDRIMSLKRSNKFSPVFNILVPQVTNDVDDMKENVDTSNLMVSDKEAWTVVQRAVSSLSKQLTETLQTQLETVEDIVRQFRDLKYAEYEAFKERAKRDHKVLSSMVHKSRGNVDNDGWRIDPSVDNDNGPPSPQLPPLQRRRLSSLRDAKKISQTIVKPNKSHPTDDDSLDAEDIFDLEGTDSHAHMTSDHDDYDSEPEGSNDEGIHIVRPRGAAAAAPDIARSLPINMPKFASDRPTPSDCDDDDEPQDIAANIKALARSVHGDVFDLPRPRFSTQI